ncbi:hypothetical protein [Rhizobium ruizarguesonis]|uniref:hypothetical protein n=1 Tax=Rhizobium ruizarguesonis TaxID=2081791 RepID=UPI00103EDE4D|nr:hypothetical protein [Rhizobium ruizarguesonis]MBY5806106.1 hypothetical protein [Rhizobium leguminosarum]TCB12113.1 hypothetical protein E0J18_24735 [Rhizobium leguminosarum bv. viciae]MBY5846856.1 hypothetical protein [Rhizobium leguminosarum]NEH87929.1 hypothetical protein [Rhizobium ruizarguesonis]NEJ58068.1 hypothetical protein [Rhizobium ruizarguesonis]
MTNKTTKRAIARFDYDALDIGAQSMKALEAAAIGIQALGRRSTGQAFELGALLEQASEHVEPGTFEKWVSQRCDISTKTARNYRAVARNLSNYRDRAVELAISPTVLFHLASAPEEKVEAALSFAEEHDGIRVNEVKTLLADGTEMASEDSSGDELADIGGLSGLRAIIDLKTKTGIAAFVERAAALAAEVVKILESKPKGKRLQKTTLIPVLEPLARSAKRSLGNVLLLDAPGDIDVRKLSQSELPAASHWYKVFATLDHLGKREEWPEAKELEVWLSHEVLPLLDWGTSRTKQPEWPLATVDARQVADAVMRSGLEALGGVVRIEAPSLDPADDEDASVDDYQPPAFLARPGSASRADADASNVISMVSTEVRSGLRKPALLKPKPAEVSAD